VIFENTNSLTQAFSRGFQPNVKTVVDKKS
jgi:hypothetical protein